MNVKRKQLSMSAFLKAKPESSDRISHLSLPEDTPPQSKVFKHTSESDRRPSSSKEIPETTSYDTTENDVSNLEVTNELSEDLFVPTRSCEESDQTDNPCAANPIPSAKDISFFVGRLLNQDEKIVALEQAWVPNKDYKFPVVSSAPSDKKSRRFRLEWLSQFNWLAYSQVDEGVYCKYCTVFASQCAGKSSAQKLGAFVSKPFKRYQNATAEFRNHAACKYHSEAMIAAENFLLIQSGKQSDIRNQIVEARRKMVEENRQRLHLIIKTIIFCGQQELPLRGHRDDQDLTAATPIENDGVFRASLRLRMDAGDSVLLRHLATAPRNAQYISPRIQNEIIDECGKIISLRIVKEVNDTDSQFFTVLADETTDVSKKEQFSVSVRYVKNNLIHERFLCFVEVHDVSGAGLATVILETLNQHGLRLNYLRGQGYDGCSAMSGQFSGCQAEIKKLWPKALYTHCSNHVLNLAVNHSCELPVIRNTLGVIQEVCNFFSSSAQRVTVIQETITETLPDAKASRLKPLCATRWVEKHHGIITFLELIEAVAEALTIIQAGRNRDASLKAQTLLNSICNVSFIASLVVMESVAGLLLPLSKQLQSSSMDIVEAATLVGDVIEVLGNRRATADLEFQLLYKKMTTLCSALDVSIQLPRRVGRQTCRDNHPAETPEEYFKLSIFIPYLDYLSNEMSVRFADLRATCSRFQCLIPSTIGSFQSARSETESFLEVANFYANDLSDSASAVEAEYERWFIKWKNTDITLRPVNVVEALAACSPSMYPNISLLLRIFATIPIATATPERTFSTLRRLKSYLRSTMLQERLNGLAHMSINRDLSISLDIDAVINGLSRRPRRLDFIL